MKKVIASKKPETLNGKTGTSSDTAAVPKISGPSPAVAEDESQESGTDDDTSDSDSDEENSSGSESSNENSKRLHNRGREPPQSAEAHKKPTSVQQLEADLKNLMELMKEEDSETQNLSDKEQLVKPTVHWDRPVAAVPPREGASAYGYPVTRKWDPVERKWVMVDATANQLPNVRPANVDPGVPKEGKSWTELAHQVHAHEAASSAGPKAPPAPATTKSWRELASTLDELQEKAASKSSSPLAQASLSKPKSKVAGKKPQSVIDLEADLKRALEIMQKDDDELDDD